MKKVFAIFAFNEIVEVYLNNTSGLKLINNREYLTEKEAEEVVEELLKKASESHKNYTILPVYVKQDWYDHLKYMYYDKGKVRQEKSSA